MRVSNRALKLLAKKEALMAIHATHAPNAYQGPTTPQAALLGVAGSLAFILGLIFRGSAYRNSCNHLPSPSIEKNNCLTSYRGLMSFESSFFAILVSISLYLFIVHIVNRRAGRLHQK